MKMIIIGAGIAGLAAGIYGQLNGFDTQIYEMHTVPGGECTGWRRKDYYFDGCIHWLLGSKAGSPLNKIWRDVGALDDSVSIVNHDIFYGIEIKGEKLFFYRDRAKLEAHFKEVAPEDSERITELSKAIDKLKVLAMPTGKPLDMLNALDMGKMMIQFMPVMKEMSRFDKITIGEYAAKFQSPILKAALTAFLPAYFNATALISTLASLADGDGGWPIGGSLAMAERMEKRYLSLNGKIVYKSRVDKILVEDGRATGIVLTDGTRHMGDYVISTADGHTTLYDMLEGKYLNNDLKTLYVDNESYPTYTSIQVSLGVDCDLSNYPHNLFVPLEKDIESGGAINRQLGFRHYCYDDTLMPKGKSALITLLDADFSWWENKYKNREDYKREKERIASEVIAAAEKYYPEIKGKIQVIDVATPMTYVRYCNAWQGAWMAFATTPKGKIRYVPGYLPGLRNFYLSGQWCMPPGGLPTAVMTGRWTVQRICCLEKKKFKTD